MKKLGKKKLTILLISLLALSVVFAVVFLLNSKYHFLADTVSPGCSTEHPYTIKAGKQIYMDGQTEIDTGFPGVPKDYLVRISREDIKNELGDYADEKTIVCHKIGSSLLEIPSFNESGEIWFQAQEDIPQNAEVQYFVSSATQARSLSLVNEIDIETHPFRTESTFSLPAPADPFWTKNIWQGASSADYSFTDDASPGGSDTIKINNFAGYADPTRTDWGVSLGGVQPFSYDPVTNVNQKDTYLMKVGWAKFSGITVPREANGTATQGHQYYSRVTDTTYRAGKWAGTNFLYVTNNVDTGWDRFVAPTIFRDQSITTGVQATAQNLSGGEIYLSSFKFIKNIKAPRELKKTVQISGRDTVVAWRENKITYFGNTVIAPLSTTNYSGSPFEIDSSTKLFLTNDFQNTYKDHYDGTELVLTSKLTNVLAARNLTITSSEVRDFKAEKSIIIGDLENDEFRNFVNILRPDIAGMNFEKEGYRILVGEKYILAVGKDMTGSYYASLRLADLFKNNLTISQRMEEDHSENSFRSLYSWNITQKEKNPDVIKDDIRKASALRYNIYAFNGPNEFQSMNSQAQRDLISDLFSYARKYFMEPMPSSFSARDVYYKDGSYKANAVLVWREREVEIDPTTKSGYLSVYITEKYTNDPKTDGMQEQDKPDIPVIVKVASADSNDEYIKNTDFIVEQRPRPSDGANSYFVTLTPESTINLETIQSCSWNAAKKCLKVTFNGLSYENHISNRISLPSVRDYIKLGIKNVFDYNLNPKYIHITNDEVFSIAADYRDLYNPDGTPTGNTPSGMLADYINDLYKAVNPEGQPKRAEVIMWSDMTNPYQQPSASYSTISKPYPFSAVDLIPKDIIMDEWFFTLGDSLNCQQSKSAAKYHIDQGFRVILSPTTEAQNAVYGCFNELAADNKDKVVGFHIPEWIVEKDDKVVSSLRAKQIWSYAVPQSGSGEVPTWHDDDFIDHPKSSFIDKVNVSDGQKIKSNPYMLSVKVKDPSTVAKVEFYIDDILIGIATLPDMNGVFDWPWDTGKYHSVVKIIVYGTDGSTEEVRRDTTVALGDDGDDSDNDATSRTPAASTTNANIVVVLPKTGEGGIKSRLSQVLYDFRSLFESN